MSSLYSRLRAAVAGQPLVQARILEVIPFQGWRPDVPGLSGFESEAKNVIPLGPFGYKPFKAFSAYSSGALTARCQGAATVPGSEGATAAYAGDATKLWRLVDQTWTDASGATYTIGDDDTWQFAKAGARILAANINDHVQGMDVGGSAFGDQITSTEKPKCKTISKISRFLMAAHTDESGTRFPNRYRWSAIDSLVDFDESTANQSDKRDYGEELGTIQRLFGGAVGYGFHQRGIIRVTYDGAGTVFRFTDVEDVGTLAPHACIREGNRFFAISHHGFISFNGFQAQHIGGRAVDQYFFDNIDPTYYHRICTAIDPEAEIVMFAFPTTSATSGNPDVILLHHWPSGWWARAAVTVEFLFPDLTKGYTLEGLDAVSASVDALPYSLDSPNWTGGILQVGAFNSSHQSGTFSGSNLEATVDTTAKQLFPGQLAMVAGAVPIADGGTITMQVAGRQRLNDSISYGTARSQSTSGKVPLRKKARYHQFRTIIAAGGTWSNMQGVQPIAAPA